MYDILTTAAVIDELSGSLPGGRIQRVGLRNAQSIALEVYRDRRRQHVVATIGDPEPAFYRSVDPFAVDPGLVTPFSLLLRKYVRGATLLDIDQPPLERIVRLKMAKRFWAHHRGDDEPDGDGAVDDAEENLPSEVIETTLVIELMGRRSNVILVDANGRVMDSLKRVTPRMSRVRPIWPSASYVLPPAWHGLDPRAATPGAIRLLLDAVPRDASLQKTLVDGVQGFSPAMASEAVWRAAGAQDAQVGQCNPTPLADAIQAIVAPLRTNSWQPCLYHDGDGSLIGYAAIPFLSLQQEGTETHVDSISAVVDAWQKTELSIGGRHDGRRNRLLARIAERRSAVNGRVRSVEKQQASVAEADRYRRWGEAIYANLWELVPGQSELEVDGERIPLDPLRQAKDAAADYFERYRRMQRGSGEVEEQLEDARTELAYLDQIETMALLASSFEEIEGVVAEWQAYAGVESGKPERRRKQDPDRVRPTQDHEGNLIYVGRSGPQNDRVTFDIAGPDDWWLHARGVPGSHVVVRGNGREPSNEALERAAAVAAYYSKSRTSGKVEVDIARRRDVRKIKGAGPGMVTYRNERTVLVSPADESRLERGK
ncbi:MAG: NFACT RNA binding domain-containing protein [Thermomicrobiales bacterium]